MELSAAEDFPTSVTWVGELLVPIQLELMEVRKTRQEAASRDYVCTYVDIVITHASYLCYLKQVLCDLLLFTHCLAPKALAKIYDFGEGGMLSNPAITSTPLKTSPSCNMHLPVTKSNQPNSKTPMYLHDSPLTACL